MKLNTEASVKSADRVFDILEYVADAPEPPSFSTMLADLGIPRSSLFHLLNNLLARKYLAQDQATERYRLGDQVRLLSQKVSGPSLSAVISPFLKDLTGELNETSGFYVQVHEAVEVVASVTSSQALAYTMKVGERAPLYAVSGGKIALTRMPGDTLDTYLREVKLEAFTPKTINSKRQLREELAVIEKKRIRLCQRRVHNRNHRDSDCGRVCWTLRRIANLAVPTVRFTQDRDIVFRRVLKSFANSIGQALASRA